MKNTLKVCACILMGWVCLMGTLPLEAATIVIGDLFKEETKVVGKEGFIEDAVFFSLDQQALQNLRKTNPQEISLALPFGNGKKLPLQLTKASYLADDLQIKIQQENTHSTLFYSPALFYKGAVNGIKDAFVALNFFETKVTGVLTIHGKNYNIGQYEKEDEGIFVLYKEEDLNIPNPFECDTEDPVSIRVEKNESTSRSNSNKKVRVYIECDYHMYKNMGNSERKVMDFTSGLFNIAAALYQQESIDIELSEVKIWSTPDPYATSSARNARNDFGKKLDGNFNGDIAHLLSNYTVNGTPPNGGSANIDVLCNKSRAVGYTNVTSSYLALPVFSWTAYAFTHEIGHNLGSPHTHSCLWPTGPIDNCWCPEGNCPIGPEPKNSGTIMSYCHLNPRWTNSCSLSSSNPGINFSQGFGKQPGDLMRLRVSNASCLSGGSSSSSGIFRVTAQVQDESCFGKEDGRITISLQNGEAPYSYQWSNGANSSNLSNVSANSYAVTVTDRRGRRAITSATVQAGMRINVDAGGDKVLGCGETVVVLDASNSVSGFQYQDRWTKVGGRINGRTTESTLTVTEPGTYIYTVTNEDTGCSASDEVVVTEGGNLPPLQLSGAVITCNRPSVRLTINNTINNGQYYWTGPNGFTSREAEPSVSNPGRYQLTVTTSAGCSTSGSVRIIAQENIPTVSGLGGVIDCQNNFVQLQGNSNQSVTYFWSGPNGFRSSLRNPITNIPGIYTLTVTSPGGCTNETTAQVGQSNAPPQVTLRDGVLSCAITELALEVITNDSPLQYRWQGPNGFASNLKNPRVSVPGVYNLVATANNGCSTNASLTITQDTEALDFDIIVNKMDCASNTVSLEMVGGENITNFRWVGPDRFLSAERKITVTRPGTYVLMTSQPNGCNHQKSYTLDTNNGIPNFSLSSSTLSCEHPKVQLYTSLSNATYTYKWTGPNNFLSYEQRPFVESAGIYTLTITNIDKCSVIKSIRVAGSVDIPYVEVAATNLSCSTNTAQLFGQTNNGDNQFLWRGPNNFISNQKSPIVQYAGIYQLTVYSPDGCTNTKSVEVLGGSLQIANVEVLDEQCGNSDGSIRIDMRNPNDTYEVIWSTGHRGLYLPRLPAGTYTATIRNSAGCAATITRTVRAAASEMRLLTVNHTAISCYDARDGQIQVSATGGEAPYYYLWSNGVEGPINNRLGEGAHALEVMDANGCLQTYYFNLENPAPLEIRTQIRQNEVEFFVEGGTPDYTYSWSNGRIGKRETGLENGTYTITIADANGCSKEVKVNIISTSQQIEDRQPNPAVSQLISPNPANSYVNLYHEYEQDELIFVSIFNAQGYYHYRKTLTTNLIQETISTANWENGIYYAQLLTKNGIITKEFKVIHN